MIQCYYGDGKGKTTAAIGQALRMAGAGKKVIVIQFLKDGNSSENIMLKKCGIKVLAKKMPEMFIDMSDSKMIKEVSEQVNNLFLMIGPDKLIPYWWLENSETPIVSSFTRYPIIDGLFVYIYTEA